MKLKFDAGQLFQIEAINSIIDLFSGQPADQGLLSTSFQGHSELFGMIQTERGYGNQLVLTDEQIQANIDLIQERNLLERTLIQNNGRNFSVEMETGTGKTYVYLRTILELSIKYGWRKYIIVVPSIAIRAGTMKSLRITNEHFRDLYSATPYEYFEYSSSNLPRVRSFAMNNTL